jgi:hypothetical protein
MIIELSQFNTGAVFSNGDWINTIPPLTIQSGGTLNFNSGFLDYATTSDVGVIEIAEDTEITITAGFYMCLWYPYGDNPNNDIFKANNIFIVNAFNLYTARYLGVPNIADWTPITSTRTFTIPKGNYSPTEITNIINENLVKINVTEFGSGSDFISNGDHNFLRPTQIGRQVADVRNAEANVGYASIKLKTPSQLGTASAPLFKVGDTISLYDNIVGVNLRFYNVHTQNYYETITIYGVDYNLGIIYMPPDYIFNTLIPEKGYFTAVSLIVYKTNVYETAFVGQEATAVSNGNYFNMANPSSMGATQIALEYNYNNNSLFQFTYAHTPFYNSSEQEVVAIYGGGVTNYFNSITTQSGIFFTQLEPASFWQDTLGFDLSTLVVNYDPVQKTFTSPLKSGVNITANFLGNDALIDKSAFATAPMIELPRKDFENESQQTEPIKALKQIGSKSSNFYLIELGGLDTINLENDKQYFRTICAISSKEYSNMGVVSIYSTGIPFYTNNGEDFVINNLRVRILDSITKQPTTTLGAKNSVFIEYFPPSIPASVPEPPKKKRVVKKKAIEDEKK